MNEVEILKTYLAHLQTESQQDKCNIAQLQSDNQQFQDTILKLRQGNQIYEIKYACATKLIARIGQENDGLREKIENLRVELFQKQETILRLDFRKNTESLKSDTFWNTHYACGGNSGTGSYNRLAQFKSEVLNAFIKQNEIATVLEIGCGDGNQLRLIQSEKYIGVDVSSVVIDKNREMFKEDTGKMF